MTRNQSVGFIGILGISALLLSGCSVLYGTADRVDEFVAANAECTGAWWLGTLREGTSEEAHIVAETALAEAEVTPEALASASDLLNDSQNDRERAQTSAVDFETEAYMMTVTLYVKDQLDAAGYPDIDRVIEIWSDSSCS